MKRGIGFASQPAVPKRFKKKAGFEPGKPKVSTRVKTNCGDHLDSCVGSQEEPRTDEWADGEAVL